MQTALILPGTSGNYVSAADSAATSPTSDVTILARVAPDAVTPGTNSDIVSKNNTNQRAFRFSIDTTGALRFAISQNGTTLLTAVLSSVNPSWSNGDTLWVLVCWRNSDDRVQFFTAPGSIANPVASDFTQLGTDQTIAATGIFDSTSVLEIGSTGVGTSNLLAGKFYRVKIYNGVFSTSAFGGTLQFDADFVNRTVTAVRTPSSFSESSSNAATVTINGSAWKWVGGADLTPASMALSGIATNPVPQPVTVSLTPAVAALSAVAVTPVPQPVTVSLTPAAIALSGVVTDPLPGQVTTALTAASVALSGVAVDPVPQPVTVNLTSAAVALSAPAIDPVPQPVQVALTAAVLALSAEPTDPQPQPVEVDLTAAVLELGGVALDPQPPEVPSVDLTSAVLALSAIALDPDPQPVTVTLAVATLTLTAVPVDADPQPITIALTVATFSVTAPVLTPVPQPVHVALTRAQLALAAVPVTAVPGVVEMTLTAAVLTLIAVAGLQRDRNPIHVTYREQSRVSFREPSRVRYREPATTVTFREG